MTKTAEADDPVDRLRELRTLAELGSLPPHIAPFVIAFTRRYFTAGEAGKPITLEAAMGIATIPGQQRWWTREPLLRRNELLRELRRRRFPRMAPRDAARAMTELLRRPDDDAFLHAVVANGGGSIQLRQLARVLS